MTAPGQIIVLNGAPRSGKSSIVAAIQEQFDGAWMNIGVDVARRMTPAALRPGIGLRPGQPDHPAAAYAEVLFAALYESVAAHSRLGLNVVVDVGHHDSAMLVDAARRLRGLPVLFVGVRCPVEVIMQRRRASDPATDASAAPSEPVPDPVLRWQAQVHGPWHYDMELDTSLMSPAECAAAIRDRLRVQPAPAAFSALLEEPASD